MELPVIEAVETVFTVVQQIHAAVKNVQGFPDNARELEERLESILAPTKAIYDHSKQSLESTTETYKVALDKLRKCLHEIRIFLLELDGKGQMSLMWNNQKICADFDKFTQRLNDLRSDLTLCITTSHYIQAAAGGGDRVVQSAGGASAQEVASQVEDLRQVINTVAWLERHLDWTDGNLSKDNKQLLQHFLSTFKDKRDSLQALVRRFEVAD